MAPAPDTTSQSQDPTTMLVGATTQVVNSKLDQLLSVVSSPSTGNAEIDESLDKIRKELDSLTATQSSEQEGIKRLLEEALNTEVLNHISGQIESQIDKNIESTVKTLVEDELNKYVPKEIRDKVDRQRSDLLSLQVGIHNSEAKRANSFIKTQKHFGEALQPLLNDKAHQIDIFPKSVNELLKLNDAQVTELVKFYGMERPEAQPRIQQLNWFLRTLGVTYQSGFLE